MPLVELVDEFAGNRLEAVEMMPRHPQLLKPRVCDLGNYSFASIIMIAVGKNEAYL